LNLANNNITDRGAQYLHDTLKNNTVDDKILLNLNCCFFCLDINKSEFQK